MSVEAAKPRATIPYWLWPWCLMLGLMPLKELVPGGPFVALEFGAGLLLALSPRRGVSLARLPFLAIAALTIWLSLTYLWSIAPGMTFDPLMRIAAAFLTYALATSAALAPEELSLALRFWLWGGIACGFALIGAMLTSHEVAGRAYLSLGAYAANPNTVSTELIVPFALALGALGLKGRRLEGVLGVVAVAGGLLATQSRGGTLAMLTVMLAYLGFRRRFALALGLVVLVVGIYAGFAADLGRFNVAEDPTGSHRTAVWAAIWPTAIANWPLGIGLGATTAVTAGAAGFYRPLNAHNTYLQAFLEAGLPGLLLLLLVMGLHLRYRGRHPHMVGLRAALCGIAVASLFDHVLSYQLLWIPWVVVFQAASCQPKAVPAAEASAAGQAPVRRPASRRIKLKARPPRRLPLRQAPAPTSQPLSRTWQRLMPPDPDLTGDAS